MDVKGLLAGIIDPDRVLTDALHRYAYAHDASVYRIVPRAVIRPRTLDEVRRLLRTAGQHGLSVTFRAAGTSLSGQAVTDSLLVDVARHFRDCEILDGGRRIRVQPGVIGGEANRRLARHRAKLGPDPASIDACMLGGILANNSSGMCCGTENNAYHTLESLRFLLADGTEVDTADPRADDRLREARPDLVRGLLALKRRIERTPELVERIRAKYRWKNTNGYSINAFLDFDGPAQILAHLMIGSEGTLGFWVEAVLRTVPDHPLRSTGLLFFDDVPRACAAIAPLKASGAAALELMDRASLRAVEGRAGMPAVIASLGDEAAALLVEYQCPDAATLEEARKACRRTIAGLPLVEPATFTERPDEQAALWRVRKGLIPSVGAMRRRGTSFIIEDVVFPVPVLADGVAGLQRLLGRHGYDDAIVFGHARDGNLHFVLTQAFDDPRDVARYDAFMRALADLVAGRYGGALKAEHGTGRNMAPFVEAEWGREAYAVMRAVKRLVDPGHLLNPGVLINDDPRAHLRHLKRLPRVEEEVDACIECGFCERTCPSRELTLTPRQRIVLRRTIAAMRAGEEGDAATLRELEGAWPYAAVDTCAADGMCATACPVGIDTGTLVKRLRAEELSATRQELARLAAARFGWLETAARAAWPIVRRFRSELPTAAERLPTSPADGAAALYFPACVQRLLGPGSLPARVVETCARAGRPLYLPREVRGHCCGLVFASKGYAAAYREAVGRTVARLWQLSDGGRLAVVCETSPCAQTLASCGADLSPERREMHAQMKILDSIEFADATLDGRLNPRERLSRVAVHPVCSAVRRGLEAPLRRVLERVAERVDVPSSAGCCGFAGDRGFRLPELTAAATRLEAAEIRRSDYDACVSSSRTCEIAMTRATGRPFVSFWDLLHRATCR